MSAVILATALAMAGVVQSHLLPLLLLTLVGGTVGLIVAVDSGDPRRLVRYPALGGLAVLVVVGVGQLGVVGLVAGALLLALVVRRVRLP